MLAIGWMSAAVTHDPGFLLAFDVTVDTRHPRTDLVHQLALTQSQDVVSPLGDAFGRGLDPRQTTLGGEADHAGDPLNTVFRGTRVIAEPSVRAHGHQQVWKPFNEDAKIGLRSVLPDILQPHPVDAADIDPVKCTGESIEPSRIDDDVEFM